jgi:hypothetical protein
MVAECKEIQDLRNEMNQSELDKILESVLETYVKTLNASMFKKPKSVREQHLLALNKLSIAVNMLVAGGASCPRFQTFIKDLDPKRFLGNFLASIPLTW